MSDLEDRIKELEFLLDNTMKLFPQELISRISGGLGEVKVLYAGEVNAQVFRLIAEGKTIVILEILP